MGSTRFTLFTLLMICLSASLVYADYSAGPSTSGKRKIAYAPFQKVSFTHISPVKKTPSSLNKDWKLKELSVKEIVDRAGDVADNHRGKIAAGWPGAQKPGAPAAAPTSQPQRKALPTSGKSHPSTAPSSQSNAPSVSGFIYGQLELDEAVKAQVKAGSVLFIIVRRYAPEGQKGMMIAATKLEGVTSSAFPLKYVVKQSDAMMGAPLVGKVSVSARIDQDGDAISKQPGDIIGNAAEAVMVGVNPVVIKLNKSL